MTASLRLIIAVLAGGVLLQAFSQGFAADTPRSRAQRKEGRRDGKRDVFLTDIPEYRGNVILGRPTCRRHVGLRRKTSRLGQARPSGTR